MKTILTATDFSVTGNNAVNYAANLALVTKAKLLIFHAYYSPLLASEVPFVTIKEDFQLEEKSDEQLDLMVNHIKDVYGTDLEVEHISISGKASLEIDSLAKKNNIDMVVIGTHEPEEFNKHFINNTIDILRRIQLPILIIPNNFEFQLVNTIVYATDFVKNENTSLNNPLLEIATLFNSKVLIYNAEGKTIKYSLKELVEVGLELETTFQNLRHSYSLSTNGNIVESLIEFAEINQTNIIAMTRRYHTIFQRLFGESNTEKMTLKTKIPLLILHDLKNPV